MTDFGPSYRVGRLSVENGELIERLDLSDCQVGIQISHDGRFWVCVNGMAYLRFKPEPRPEPLLVCTECGERGVPRGETVCNLCGGEQHEPFRVGWDAAP